MGASFKGTGRPGDQPGRQNLNQLLFPRFSDAREWGGEGSLSLSAQRLRSIYELKSQAI
jgi:hypothetical protein